MKNMYQTSIDLKNAGNARRVFDLMMCWEFGYETLSILGSVVCEAVAKGGEGFVVDIANRALEQEKNGKGVRLSAKQTWCLVFAFMKLEDSIILAIEQEAIAEEETEEKNEETEEKNEENEEKNEENEMLTNEPCADGWMTVGFETYEEAEAFSEIHGGDIVRGTRRAGESSYKLRDRAFEAFSIRLEDIDGEFESLYNRGEEDLFKAEAVEYMEELLGEVPDEIRSRIESLHERISSLGDNEQLAILANLEYSEVHPIQTMRFFKDSNEYVIGVWSEKRIEL
jgi:hypothetical protein